MLQQLRSTLVPLHQRQILLLWCALWEGVQLKQNPVDQISVHCRFQWTNIYKENSFQHQPIRSKHFYYRKHNVWCLRLQLLSYVWLTSYNLQRVHLDSEDKFLFFLHTSIIVIHKTHAVIWHLMYNSWEYVKWRKVKAGCCCSSRRQGGWRGLRWKRAWCELRRERTGGRSCLLMFIVAADSRVVFGECEVEQEKRKIVLQVNWVFHGVVGRESYRSGQRNLPAHNHWEQTEKHHNFSQIPAFWSSPKLLG